MATLAAPTTSASSCLEKVLEHRFVAELSTRLWLDGFDDFEVLRCEVDSHGYDVVIEANEVIRHIQLKGITQGGKRRDVSINTRLAAKPSGCVIWMVYDPATLALGPFYWFGGEPGERLPPLGDRIAKHSRANSFGLKAERPGHRLVPRSQFALVDGMEPLAALLFGCGSRTSAGEGAGQEQLNLLKQHLVSIAVSENRAVLAGFWDGEQIHIPEPLTWDNSVEFAHAIEGYKLVREAGWGDPFRFADRRLSNAVASNCWEGGPAELWASLFLEHRRWRMAPCDPNPGMNQLLDRLCDQLESSLRAAS